MRELLFSTRRFKAHMAAGIQHKIVYQRARERSPAATRASRRARPPRTAEEDLNNKNGDDDAGPLAGWLTVTVKSLLQRLIDADEMEVKVLGSVSQAIARGTLPKLRAKARGPRYKGVCGTLIEAEVMEWQDRPIQRLLKTSIRRDRERHSLLCQLHVTLELSSVDLKASFSSSSILAQLLPAKISSGSILRAEVMQDAILLERENQKSVLLLRLEHGKANNEISLVILEPEEEAETKSWKVSGVQVHSIEYLQLDRLRLCFAIDVTS